jgi:hypothetical protein
LVFGGNAQRLQGKLADAAGVALAGLSNFDDLLSDQLCNRV